MTKNNDATKSFEQICRYAMDYYGPCLTPQEIQSHMDVVSATLIKSAILEKALDAATETFKEERQKWATEKRSLERRLKEAKSAQVDGLVKLIKIMIDNDPNETISDAGHTVYQHWKHDALGYLKQFSATEI